MPEEQRRHPRPPVESAVFIELVAAEAGSAEPSEIVICKTLDASRRGLRVTLDQELLVGSILQIGVELADSADTLYLAGEVRWCLANKAPETGWSAGLALLNANGSDIDHWVLLLAHIENRE